VVPNSGNQPVPKREILQRTHQSFEVLDARSDLVSFVAIAVLDLSVVLDHLWVTPEADRPRLSAGVLASMRSNSRDSTNGVNSRCCRIRLRKGSIFAWASRIRVDECLRACPAAPCSPFIAFDYRPHTRALTQRNGYQAVCENVAHYRSKLIRFAQIRYKRRAMPTLGVFAAITDEDGRILCLRMNYATHAWTTPGGRVEIGESPLDALKREVLEESGLDVVAEELVGVYSKPKKDDIVLFFRARVVAQSPWQPTDEDSSDGLLRPGVICQSLWGWVPAPVSSMR